MANKEIEQKLRESAENIEMRDFEEVWQEIEPKILQEPKKTAKSFRRWLPMIASVICIVVVAGIATPFIVSTLGKNNSSSEETRYLESELERREVQDEAFFEAIEQSDLQIVDISAFELLSSFIYYDDTENIRGGFIEAYKEQSDLFYYFTLNFYDTSIDFSDKAFSNLELTYTTTKSVKVDYIYNTVYNVYFVCAEYNNINYYMKYTDNGQEITQFFEDFFQ